MGLYHGQVDNCLWGHFHAEVSDAMWTAYIVRAQEFFGQLAASGMSGGVITFTWKAPPINARRRKELADLLASPKAKHVSAHALVTDSRAVQMVLKAMDWFVRKSYSEQVFTESGAALDWLQKAVQLDRSKLVRAILQEVPALERDPSLVYLISTGAVPKSSH